MAELGLRAVTTFPLIPTLMMKNDSPCPKPINNPQASFPSLRRTFPSYQQQRMISAYLKGMILVVVSLRMENIMKIVCSAWGIWLRFGLLSRLKAYPPLTITGHQQTLYYSSVEKNIEPVDELRRFIKSTGMKLEVVDSGLDDDASP